MRLRNKQQLRIRLINMKSSHYINGSNDEGKTSPEGLECEPFPTLPLSVQEPQPDSVTEHCFSRLRGLHSDITELTLIYAAWALVSGRMANSETAVFGVEVLGSKSAPVPMLVKTASHQTILEYLQAVQRQGADATPQEETRIPKADCPACVFQTLFVVQPPKNASTPEVAGAREENSSARRMGTQSLTLELCFGSSYVRTRAIFDSRVIMPWIMRTLLERLEYIMQQLATMSPQETLANLNIVTSQDLDKIWSWNSTVPLKIERCVHEIIEERVSFQPHAPAVCAWDGKLTFGELNTLATRLARRLIKLGIGPHKESIVPLCFHKSMWTTVAMLAVLKAGGAFLLLDPSLPETRLELMVQRVRAKLVLSSVSAQLLCSKFAEEVVIVGPGTFSGPESQVESSVEELPRQSPSSLVYVSFTSGSTGTPKCVKITHSNLASALYHQIGIMGLTENSRVFDFASYSFTTSICNVTGGLAAGGCLCVPSDQDRRDRLPEAIRSLQANFVDLTPSVIQFLSPEEVSTLEVLVVGGEALRARDVKPWWGKVRMIHLYGQSECTSNGTINCDASSPEKALSIGKGAGLVTWIVDPDDHNSLQPLGCSGELLFEGPLVGDGYLNDPERTAAAFIEDPTWLLQGCPGRPGRHGRLYKTGDLVQYDEDGNLLFIGRKDTQVKIRGQRVELGEVEHWVQSCMLEAAQVVAEVIKPRGLESSRALVAFLQMKHDEAVESDDTERAGMAVKLVPMPTHVEDQLASHLPSYMVPTALFSMQKLPMTATGKVNRKQLREMGESFSVEQLAGMRTARPESKRQPTSEAERCLQEIWAAVLNIGVARIGLDDSFFHLGGDSIAAMKVVAEARKVGIGLTVADLFSHPRLQDVTKQSISVSSGPEERVAPFALLGEQVDVTSFLQDVSSLLKLDPDKIVDAYPCAPLQEGLVSLGSKKSGNYVMQDVLELSPSLDVKDLRKAWEQVSRAMPILRTRIVLHNELGLLQIELDEEIRWIEATDLNVYLEADRRRPMNLGEPLTRYALVEDGAGIPRWFVWTMHHAIYDGWSMRLIMTAVYRAIQGLSIETGASVQAFIKYIKDLDEDKLLDYWTKTLAGYEGAPFPTLPSSVKEPTADQEEEYRFSPPIRSLKDVTTSTLLRAAWAVLVSHISNADDVVFGATVSGRNAPVAGIDSMAAPTFATIPLRVKVNPRQRVSEYLRMVQQQAVDMIPFEQAGLHRIAKMSRDSQRACQFQSQLVIQPHVEDSSADVDILGTWQSTKQQLFNTYALMLEIRPAADKITAIASFDSRVVQPWLVRRMLSRLEFVMQQLRSSCDDESLSKISVMTPKDLEQIWEWNRDLPTPIEKCAHQMIQERVIAQPNAPAICAWDGELSYQELDQLSSRLVGRLVELGVGPDILVPLCFEKSMWTTVAMLGVLKAGGGFVLLDASLPQQRLQTMVEQLNSSFVLSSPANLALSSRLSKTVIQLGPASISFFDSSATQSTPQLEPKPTDAMFAVFTSGSTGTPKGAVLSHLNFCSGLKHQLHLLDITPSSRVFDFASYAFDVAVHNSIAALVAGGCMCIPAEHERRDDISEAMVKMQSTVVSLTPSVARLIDPSTVPKLETLILAGEPVSVGDVTRWWGKTRVINAYGPAECNISTINSGQSSPEDATHIGKGAGLVTWIVDPENHNVLLPPGHVGELLLEGPLVGRGYLGDTEKTEQSFIRNPAWLAQVALRTGRPEQRGRVYKTGDLVRYNEDGSLAFVGRKDAQVKIRGQRVELGEVEHWVQSYMDAVQVVAEVVVPEGESSSPTLVAFLQVRNEPESTEVSILPVPRDLKERLAGRLPSYMMPAVFLSIRQIPMTPTGKTDRKRLREIGSSFSIEKLIETNGAQLKREPNSDAERRVQTIWARVLGVEPCTIGADDSFFHLGGDSISAMAVVSEARKLGLHISVADIFRTPKLHQLAMQATSSTGVTSDKIPNYQIHEDMEQSFAQERIWTLNQLHPSLTWHSMPWAVRLRGPLQLEALNTALIALESRHEALRTTFGVREGVKMQFMHPVYRKDLALVDVSPDADKGLEDALQQDRATPFNLQADPGWRLKVYRIDEEEHVLSVVIHHIVSDGWSLDIFRQDLATFYSAALRGQDPLTRVDAPSIQYRDYSFWQRQQVQMELQQRQLDYWMKQLETSQPAEFPCDNPRPGILSGQTDAAEIRIEDALYHCLQSFCRRRGVTLFVVLLAAFRATHFHLAGAMDATIGTASANRGRWETRLVIGPFVNLQCIRVRLGSESFEEVVRQVHASTITSFANQDVPFDRILSSLQEDEGLSRHPLVQVILAVHSRLDIPKFTLDGVATEQITMPVTSRFDLEFHIYQEQHALRGSLTFSTDLYRLETINNVLRVFRQVLEQGLANPKVAVASLPLAQDDERSLFGSTGLGGEGGDGGDPFSRTCAAGA